PQKVPSPLMLTRGVPQCHRAAAGKRVDGRNSSNAVAAYDRRTQRRGWLRNRSRPYSRKTTDSPIARIAGAPPRRPRTGSADSPGDSPSTKRRPFLCPQYPQSLGPAFHRRDEESRNSRHRLLEQGSKAPHRLAFEEAAAVAARDVIAPLWRLPTRA